MSVSSLLKNYRAENNLTQDDLAERLNVAKITVARLESGNQVKLSPRMIVKVANLFSEDELSRLDSSDPQEKKLLEYRRYGKYQLENCVQEKAWITHAIMGFGELAEKIGYLPIDGSFGQVEPYTYGYQNKDSRKTWTVQFVSADCSKTVNCIRRYLVTRVGSALLFGDKSVENKITIAIPNSFDEIEEQLDFHIPAYLPFDISILHFRDDGSVRQETYLHCNTDGRGIFDLDVDDTALSAQAGKDYVAWTRAVGNIVTWEKNK